MTTVLIAVLIMGTALSSGVVAQAQTFEFHQPSFGLYCENSEAIQEGEVSFALGDFQSTKLETSSHSRYQIKTEVGKTEHFSIPFIARAYEIPEFAVSANGKAVEGQVSFGDSYFDYTDIDLKEALRSVVSSEPPEETGIFYSIKPTAETVELTIERDKGQRFIEGFKSTRSSHYASGKDIFTIDTKQEGENYLFVIGEEAVVTAVGAELEKENMNCKDYVDRFYTELKEYYDEMGGVPVEFFYSQLNSTKWYEQEMDYLFFDSCASLRLMTYDFSVVAEAENFEIEYSQEQLRVMSNGRFSPAVYMLEQRAAGGYTAKYTFSLSEGFPFLLESRTEAHKGSDGSYSITEQGTDFYCVFCSEAKPNDLLAPEDSGKPEAWRIALWCILGVAGVGLCICVGLLIQMRIKSKKK